METPSQTLIAQAQQVQSIQDSEGRILTIRKLSALDRLRLFKAAGPTLSQNHLWLGMATLAASTQAIDDVPIPPPINEAQIESLVARLGDSGLSAIAQALSPASQTEPEPQAGN